MIKLNFKLYDVRKVLVQQRIRKRFKERVTRLNNCLRLWNTNYTRGIARQRTADDTQKRSSCQEPSEKNFVTEEYSVDVNHLLYRNVLFDILLSFIASTLGRTRWGCLFEWQNWHKSNYPLPQGARSSRNVARTNMQYLLSHSHALRTALPMATISATLGISTTLLSRSCPAACQSANVLHGPLLKTLAGLYSVLLRVCQDDFGEMN